ncbi:MAG: hypothetical protein DKT66_06475 [Candidatus Melainabacteria bacterium]|nr:MAG: hypothetical protein DKT66_06475 [Candidatus Melainabacteria bacterium]
MNDKSVQKFLQLSSVLTGFSLFELRASDCTEEFYETTQRQIGRENLEAFLANFADTTQADIDVSLANSFLGPIAKNIIRMWYVGNWVAMPDEWWAAHSSEIFAANSTFVVSSQAYKEGLVWKAADTHPMGSKSGGFGSWALPPAETK